MRLEHLPPLRYVLKHLLIVLAIAAVAGYSLFEARRLIEGPQISIVTPRDGGALGGPTLVISGLAQNVSFLSINGKQAFVDEHDRFSERLSPPPGYTVITVSGKDRFGRSVAKAVHVTFTNYCQATPAA